jgi:hypothetical protein
MCLAVAFGMLIWGRTVLEPYLQGNGLLIYWLIFLTFTCSAVALGLLDFFALRRFLKAEQSRLAARALRNLHGKNRVNPDKTADSGPIKPRR